MTIRLSKDNPFNNFKNDKNATVYSMNWFNKTIDKLLKSPHKTKEDRVSDTLGDSVGSITPGSMYAFRYDPRHKDTLPIYDTFPLIFPLRKMGDHFLGLNLHYIGADARVAMLGILMEYANTPNISKSTRLRLSWQVIQSFSKLKPLEDCVKMYLFSHVRSKFIMIDPENWVTAARLPLENFVRKTK